VYYFWLLFDACNIAEGGITRDLSDASRPVLSGKEDGST